MAAPVITKEQKRHRAEQVHEELKEQTCTFGCATCGIFFEVPALDGIAWQVEHRQDVHGLRKTDIARKQRDAERRAKRTTTKYARSPETRAKLAAAKRQNREEAKRLALDAIRGNDSLANREDVAEAAGIKPTAAMVAVRDLREEGLITKDSFAPGGFWRLVEDAA